MTVRRYRMLAVYIIIGIVLGILTVQNDAISYEENFRKAQPFFLSSVAFLLVILVMWIRTPKTTRWYLLWQSFDPLVIVLTGLLAAAAVYDWALWLGQSQRYNVPVWVYDDARLLKWISGYASIGVLMEMAIVGVMARRRNQTRDQRIYDNPGADD